MTSNKEWQTLVEQKLEERESQIPQEWRIPKEILDKVSPTSTLGAFHFLENRSLLTERELSITELSSARALVTALARGELTAVEVCFAFCKRAAIAQQLVRIFCIRDPKENKDDEPVLTRCVQTNCATEIFFDDALKRALYLDEYFAKEKKTLGPFHGLPISLKVILPSMFLFMRFEVSRSV